jgi:hypothetical protein
MDDQGIAKLMTISLWLESARGHCREEPAPSKRHCARYRWDTALELRVGKKIHYVLGRNISTCGIGVLSRAGVTPGRTVELRRTPEDPWVGCRVMHNTQSVGAYRVGLAFEAGA